MTAEHPARLDYRPVGHPGGQAAPSSQSDRFAARPTLLFCGGFHSNMRGNKAEFLDRYCREQGLAFTRFDYRGHGETPGETAAFGIADWLDDTLEVLDSLPDEVLLIGSSLGAWLACLAAAERPDKIVGLLLLAAAADFTEELLWPTLDAAQRAAIDAGRTVRVANAYDDDGWYLKQRLFDSGRKLRVLGKHAARLERIRCPVRLVHGTADTDVPWSLSARLLDAMPHDDVRLLLVKGGDHRLSDTASLGIIGNEIRGILAALSGEPEERNRS
ncbi:MAG: alpha/beta hydrolase [Gammaproteobacteria bacterium]|nr:MAG: alpha/beta hydrolase [Gammaproteobacteria bacterium]PIE36999.1 MAG: alpha/beta hydrolase [Gammaproteobacteria bacterium]